MRFVPIPLAQDFPHEAAIDRLDPGADHRPAPRAVRHSSGEILAVIRRTMERGRPRFNVRIRGGTSP